MKKITQLVILLVSLTTSSYAAKNWWSLSETKGSSLVFINSAGASSRIGGLSCQNQDCSMIGVHSSQLGRLLNVISHEEMMYKLENSKYKWDFWEAKQTLNDFLGGWNNYSIPEKSSAVLAATILVPLFAMSEGVREVHGCMSQSSVVAEVIENFKEVSSKSCSTNPQELVIMASGARGNVLRNLIQLLSE